MCVTQNCLWIWELFCWHTSVEGEQARKYSVDKNTKNHTRNIESNEKKNSFKRRWICIFFDGIYISTNFIAYTQHIQESNKRKCPKQIEIHNRHKHTQREMKWQFGFPFAIIILVNIVIVVGVIPLILKKDDEWYRPIVYK